MHEAQFNELLASVREAGEIVRQVDETIRIFAQSRVVLEQYHEAMRQAQPPIVTRCWTHTTRLTDFIAALPADEQQRIDELTQQLLDKWDKQDRNIMHKKIARLCLTHSR